MTADKPSHLVPKLRFAEFVDEPPWECPPLKKLAKRITQRNTRGADLRALTNSAEHGVVDQREYFGRDIATNTDNYYIVETGDYVYNPRSSSTAPVGPISKNQIGTGVMSPLYTVLRFRSDANDFFAHYFWSSHWHGYLRRVSNSGARHDRMAITNDDLMQMPIPTPTAREQRKIAACLGSLDDLIATDGQKLEALRQHKQGLMQQLFPQPGETVPRLRFPEFVDAPHWQTSTFGERCEPFSGGTPHTSNSAYFGGTIPFIRSAEIGRDETEILLTEEGLANSAAKMVKRGDLLVALYGANSGETALARIDGAINQAIMCLRSHDSAPFLYHYLTARKNWIVATYLQGGQGNLSGQIVKSLPLSVPHRDEQEKVADCLSTLDARIEGQAQGIDALRRHRQGLHQQLFASPEGH